MMKRIDPKDVYTEEVGALYDEAATSCDPESREVLLDLAAQHGVNEQSLVLDVGCANGGVSRKLLSKTGCRIKGVELLNLLVEMGNKQNEELGVDDRFEIHEGSITNIPFPENTFDFVFCNDVVGMVEDMQTAMSECSRVLKPNGKMLVYASFATDRLSEKEASELNDSLGNARNGTDFERAVQAIERNFSVIEKRVIGSQFTQFDVEKQKNESEATKNLLRTAHLLTWPDKYKEKYGEKVYRIVLAEVQWSVFILLGKLQPTIFIVQKT